MTVVVHSFNIEIRSLRYRLVMSDRHGLSFSLVDGIAADNLWEKQGNAYNDKRRPVASSASRTKATRA